MIWSLLPMALFHLIISISIYFLLSLVLPDSASAILASLFTVVLVILYVAESIRLWIKGLGYQIEDSGEFDNSGSLEQIEMLVEDLRDHLKEGGQSYQERLDSRLLYQSTTLDNIEAELNRLNWSQITGQRSARPRR